MNIDLSIGCLFWKASLRISQSTHSTKLYTYHIKQTLTCLCLLSIISLFLTFKRFTFTVVWMGVFASLHAQHACSDHGSTVEYFGTEVIKATWTDT